MPEKLCHCGKPLHYNSPRVRAIIERMIEELGDDIVVTVDGKSYRVPRHYIALHGLKSEEIPSLGFPEVEVRYA